MSWKIHLKSMPLAFIGAGLTLQLALTMYGKRSPELS